MNRPVDLPVHALDLDDIDLNNSGNRSFNAVLDARLSRRALLRGGVGSAAGALLGGFSLSACGAGGDDPAPATRATPAGIDKLAFTAVPKSRPMGSPCRPATPRRCCTRSAIR